MNYSLTRPNIITRHNMNGSFLFQGHTDYLASGSVVSPSEIICFLVLMLYVSIIILGIRNINKLNENKIMKKLSTSDISSMGTEVNNI